MSVISFACIHCGKVVQRYTSSSAGKYCSLKCYREHSTNCLVEKTCPVCGKHFLGKRAQIYCSPKCKKKNDYQKYEVGEYKVTCPLCGQERSVAKKPKRDTLCTKCRGVYARQISPMPKGEHSSAWKGGKRVDTYGYVKLHRRDHPFADSTGYVREHLLVVSDAYGEDYIREHGGVVHHINGDKQDNRLENLYICTSAQNKAYTSELLQMAYDLVKTGII